LNECLHDNFWLAFDSLEDKKSSLVFKGINLAKDLQQAIIRTGNSLIDRKEVKVASNFRYVNIENDYLADIKLFQFPLALKKLGMFVMENYANQKKSSKSKPLVMAVKNSKSGQTLILAVLGYNCDLDDRNDFGQRFKAAAYGVNVKTKHESFETDIIEIKNEDYRSFMQSLTEI